MSDTKISAPMYLYIALSVTQEGLCRMQILTYLVIFSQHICIHGVCSRAASGAIVSAHSVLKCL